MINKCSSFESQIRFQSQNFKFETKSEERGRERCWPSKILAKKKKERRCKKKTPPKQNQVKCIFFCMTKRMSARSCQRDVLGRFWQFKKLAKRWDHFVFVTVSWFVFYTKELALAWLLEPGFQPPTPSFLNLNVPTHQWIWLLTGFHVPVGKNLTYKLHIRGNRSKSSMIWSFWLILTFKGLSTFLYCIRCKVVDSLI